MQDKLFVYISDLDCSELENYASTLGFSLYNNCLQIKEDYNLNKLLRFINRLYTLNSEIHLFLLVEPFEFIHSSVEDYTVLVDDVQLIIPFKKVSITKTNLKNGLVEGYFAYYKKKSKQQKEQRSTLIFEKVQPIIKEGFKEVESMQWFKPGLFKSTYILGPQLTNLRNKLIDMYLQEVVPEFKQIVIPKYTTEQLFAKSNHIRLPQHSYIITKFEPTVVSLKEFYGHIFKQWRIDRGDLRVGGVSTYGVCEPFWTYFENTIVDSSFKYFDKSGPSLRNEGNATKGLERLDVFSRIELIFGDVKEEALVDYVKTYLSRIESFFDRLQLHYRLLEVDSWTPSNSKERSTKVKTYDVEIYLAYKNQWLEVCNISNNGIIFSSAFNVKNKKGDYIYTGCGGIGIERLLFGVIEQKGYKHILEL